MPRFVPHFPCPAARAPLPRHSAHHMRPRAFLQYMDIPLKLLPRVLLTRAPVPRDRDSSRDSHERRLTRTYSETETNNFDADTGRRLFDDGRIRAKPLRTALPERSRSRSRGRTRARAELADEYVPGLDFGESLANWDSLREALYLDLQQLHAQVAPQPILAPQQPKKAKPLPVSFEAVLAGLPHNFSELPYLQRKKLVQLFSELIDYSQFSQFAKALLSLGRTLALGLLRRSSTVAGRLLALLLLADLRKKRNVDERGALVLGHELGKVIGHGAWGTIRECVGPHGVRAVKIVRLQHADGRVNPDVLERFRAEIAIWLRMRHEHILPLLDHAETGDAIFCLTTRIAGGTLFDKVSAWGAFDGGIDSATGPILYSVAAQRRRLVQTAVWAGQVVAALAYLHGDLGVVHGDVKLENVLVDAHDGHERAVLCDFGMSRVFRRALLRSRSSQATLRRPYECDVFSDDHRLAPVLGISQVPRTHGPALQSVELSELPHSHIGLLPYALPELLAPQPPPLGPSADVWALGVLLYTMCVGRLPFEHLYEPRLRATILAGQYSHAALRQACLEEWVSQTRGLYVDLARQAQVAVLRKEWGSFKGDFLGLRRAVEGCLERDLMLRWELGKVGAELEKAASGCDKPKAGEPEAAKS